MLDWLKHLFSDSNDVSFKRFIGLLAFICIALAFVANLYKDKMIDDTLLYVMASIVGTAIGGAVIEKSIKYMTSKNTKQSEEIENPE